MTKTKIIKDLKVLGLVAIGIAIGASAIIIYTKGLEMYRFVTEIQTWEDSYFQSKSNEVTSIEPEESPMGEHSKGKTVALSDQVAPEGEIVASPSPTSNKQLIAEKGKEVFGEQEAEALVELVYRESSFNHKAKNPESTAYGLFQFLDSTWTQYGEKTSDPEKQVEYGLAYIKDRYQTPSRALAYHNMHNSY